MSDFNLLRLKGLDKILTIQGPEGVLPPPTPAEHIEEWPGHGYFWKGSDSKERFNDVGALDFDALEGGFCRLKGAKVMYADYAAIAKEYGLEGKSQEEINKWLIDNAAYVSEGQIKRIQPGGDLYDWMEQANLNDAIDYTS